MSNSIENAHTIAGTSYTKEGVLAYSLARHGSDGSQFLDPVFTAYLNNLNDQEVIDVGCGAGPWAIYAANHGARSVLAVDYQLSILAEGKKAVQKEDLNKKVLLANSDGAILPVGNDSFSLALSVNVGCNLPNASIVKVEGTRPAEVEVGFPAHFKEMARVLQKGGKAVITAPTSFEEIFTQGNRPKEEVVQSIQDSLNAIGDTQDVNVIKSHLEKLSDVNRATFAWRDSRWIVVTDEKELKSGEKIWRKLPGLVVPNFYHSAEEYVKVATEAGLRLVEEKQAMFVTEEERLTYNASVSTEKHLGPEYVKERGGKPPFVVFVFEK